jgi:hypothetical protein
MKTYSYRPLRESRQDRQTQEIQRDIDFMREMYAARRSANHQAHNAFLGRALLVAMSVPAIATLIYLIVT